MKFYDSIAAVIAISRKGLGFGSKSCEHFKRAKLPCELRSLIIAPFASESFKANLCYVRSFYLAAQRSNSQISDEGMTVEIERIYSCSYNFLPVEL